MRRMAAGMGFPLGEREMFGNWIVVVVAQHCKHPECTECPFLNGEFYVRILPPSFPRGFCELAWKPRAWRPGEAPWGSGPR